MQAARTLLSVVRDMRAAHKLAGHLAFVESDHHIVVAAACRAKAAVVLAAALGIHSLLPQPVVSQDMLLRQAADLPTLHLRQSQTRTLVLHICLASSWVQVFARAVLHPLVRHSAPAGHLCTAAVDSPS